MNANKVVVDKWFSWLDAAQLSLQDSNNEKNRLELSRGRLSNGQVSDQKGREGRESKRKVISSSLRERKSRERKKISITYL